MYNGKYSSDSFDLSLYDNSKIFSATIGDYTRPLILQTTLFFAIMLI